MISLRTHLAIWFLLLSGICALGLGNNGVPPFFGSRSMAIAALAIDGSPANNKGNSSATVTLSVTAPMAGDIIVVATNCYRTSAQGSVTTVSSIASTNLPSGGWNLRKRLQMTGNNSSGIGITAYNDLEIQWAYSSGTLSAESITVTYAAACDCVQGYALPVKGFVGTAYQTAPWDTNASLSATNTNQNVGDLNPKNPNISTTAANVMFFQAAGSYGGSYTQVLTSDGTCCSGGAMTNVMNAGGTRLTNLAVQYGPVPNRGSTVTSYTLTQGGSMSFTNHSIADALTSP